MRRDRVFMPLLQAAFQKNLRHRVRWSNAQTLTKELRRAAPIVRIVKRPGFLEHRLRGQLAISELGWVSVEHLEDGHQLRLPFDADLVDNTQTIPFRFAQATQRVMADQQRYIMMICEALDV